MADASKMNKAAPAPIIKKDAKMPPSTGEQLEPHHKKQAENANDEDIHERSKILEEKLTINEWLYYLMFIF